MAAYCVLAALLFWIGGEEFYYRVTERPASDASSIIGEITSDTVVTQRVKTDGNELMGLTFIAATFDRANDGTLLVEILEDERVLGAVAVNLATVRDNAPLQVEFSPPLLLSARCAEVRITAPESEADNAITLYQGGAFVTSRGQVDINLKPEDRAFVNGSPMDGALCIAVRSRQELWLGKRYWTVAGVGLVALALYSILLLRQNRKGKYGFLLRVLALFSRYGYLMRQLVERDFKTKYKRSSLGVLWSFFNPLLTMLVQYVVFSRLFRSSILNFPVYLLSGIVCYNFFNEATTMTLTSIVGNASLITKVYVPKYIYPFTRTLSSTINFLLALIPLFIVLAITHTPLTRALFLLPFGVLCLFCVSLGVGLALASAMVFFRDTQFLWGVLSMVWMYLTPIFYPESIISQEYMAAYRCNPLYHIIGFIRTVLMDGVSPEPMAYALCLISGLAPLAIGAYVFKRNQDQFVLNL